MKKYFSFTLLFVLFCQSMDAQEGVSEMDFPSQQAEDGYWQSVKKRAAETRRWIKKNPKKAAAIGLGVLAGIGVSKYGPKLKQIWSPDEASMLRAELKKGIERIKNPSSFFNLGFHSGYSPLLFKHVYQGQPLGSINLYNVRYGGDPKFARAKCWFLSDLKYFNSTKGKAGFDVGDNLLRGELDDVVETKKGHSLIGAAIISPVENGKKERIVELLSHGVKLTDDDKKLLGRYYPDFFIFDVSVKE